MRFVSDQVTVSEYTICTLMTRIHSITGCRQYASQKQLDTRGMTPKPVPYNDDFKRPRKSQNRCTFYQCFNWLCSDSLLDDNTGGKELAFPSGNDDDCIVYIHSNSGHFSILEPRG